MAILKIGKEGNNNGKQRVKGYSKGHACEDFRRVEKGDCCQESRWICESNRKMVQGFTSGWDVANKMNIWINRFAFH